MEWEFGKEVSGPFDEADADSVAQTVEAEEDCVALLIFAEGSVGWVAG